MAKKKTVGKKATTRKKTAATKTTRVANRAPASKKKTTRKASSVKAAAPKATSVPKVAARKKVAKKAPAKLDVAAMLSHPDHEPPTEEQLAKVKTGLTKRDLEKYRVQLMEKRAELLGDVASLQIDARNGAGASISYEHMADTGSDNYEQEFTLGLVASEKKLLGEIDQALGRIQRGCYGVCIESGVPIGKPRLDAKPWARYCIEVAREKERRGQM